MQFVNIHTHRPTGRHIEPTAVGVHPWEALTGDFQNAEQHFGEADFIGETGLDYACNVPRDAQEALFLKHLEAAVRLGKPVILHCVRAFEPMMKILEHYPLRAVVFHGFIGSQQQAAQALRRGYYLSFGHKSFASPRSVEALRAVPVERLFLETDDSDIPIERIYEQAAEVKQLTLTDLQDQLLKNLQRISR